MNQAVNKDLLISTLTNHVDQLGKLVTLQQEQIDIYEQSMETYRQRDLVRDKLDYKVDEMIKAFHSMQQKIKDQEDYINQLHEKLEQATTVLKLTQNPATTEEDIKK